MLKSRFGKLGASLIYCSEGEREHVGVRERKTERARERARGGNIFIYVRILLK